MFIGTVTNNGKSTTSLYTSYDQWYSDTFSPCCKYELVDLKVKGKTYKERKESLSETAHDFIRIDQGGLSYGELAIIQNWFRTNAKRYGLLKEFEENYIC